MKLDNPQTKKKAHQFREVGYSLSEISNLIKIPKSTVQGWVKNIKLTKTQRARLKKKEIECGKNGLLKAVLTNKNKIEKWKKDVFQRTKKYKNLLNKKGGFAKLICGALYLCEGAKYPATRHLAFGNSDPRMIALFLDLLRKNFDIDEKKIRCRIMHRHDQNGQLLNKYWSKLTKIPLSQFYKNYKDIRTKGKTTKKPDYKGICAVQYFSTDLQYELQLIGETLYSLKK